MSVPRKEVINWYATSGKEKGMIYPGTRVSIDGESYWQECQAPTRQMIDNIPRPIAGIRIPYIGGRNEAESSFENCCHVPSKYLTEHSSEANWNVPIDHPRHLLNFPQEILEKILEHCVMYPGILEPDCVARNNQEGYCMAKLPSYSASPDNHEVWRVHRRRIRERSTGRLLTNQFVKIWRRPVDATVLRVNKLLHGMGATILYGKNTFEFNLKSQWSSKGIDPTIPLRWYNSDGTVTKFTNIMPRESAFQTPVIQNDIKLLMDANHQADWTFTNPFTRFLKTIGKQNASLIKNLRFIGRVWLPDIAAEDQEIPFVNAHYPNLIYYLRVYSMFIELYCPDLRKLDIRIPEFIARNYGRKLVARQEFTNDKDYIVPEEFSKLELRLAVAEERPRNAYVALIDEILPRIKMLEKFTTKSHRSHVLDFPSWRDNQGFVELFRSWVVAADKEMIQEAEASVAAALRERQKHPELVALNEMLGYTDSLEANHARQRWLDGNEIVEVEEEGL